MPRCAAIACLSLLISAAPLFADEIKGRIKEVDPDKDALIVIVNKKDQEFHIAPETKLVDAAGKELKNRLRAFQAGATVTLTTEKKDGKDVVLEVKLISNPAKPAAVYTEAEKAGPDFAIQGEYVGKDESGKRIGIQVVAEGDGKFAIAAFEGGLPGDGWNGKKPATRKIATIDGKTQAKFIDDKEIQVANGKVSILYQDKALYALDKVIRKSTSEGAQHPKGALILFDGKNADEWNGGKLVESNLLGPGVTTKKEFRDFTLHIEFRLPFKPLGRGQNRANSGVYLQQRYEIQILDSFGLEGKNNECGAIYTQLAPSVNMCFPPLSWQTYDIDFQAARFDDKGNKTANAVISVVHNGVKIHDKVEVKGPTGHGKKEIDTPGPINLQNHGNPVHFRNIWIVSKDKP